MPKRQQRNRKRRKRQPPARRQRARKRRKRQQPTRRVRPQLVYPRVWFKRVVAEDLWMPERQALTPAHIPQRRRRRRRRGPQKKRARVQPPAPPPTSPAAVRGLCTSWFAVTNYIDQDIGGPWRTDAMPKPRTSIEVDEDLQAVAGVAGDSINSVARLRLYPTRAERRRLEQMFATNRAIYNKLVARSRTDRLVAMRSRVKKTRMNLKTFAAKYRPIAQKSSMGEFFRNRQSLVRHLQVNEEVSDSAFRDFIKAVKSSRAGFFAALEAKKSTTYPDLTFRSRFARSSSIELRVGKTHAQRVRVDGKCDRIRIHSRFFGFKRGEGIALREALPDMEHSIRLQRCRGGRFYVIVPRHVQHAATQSERVCALDPGVRNFVTLYDPEGRVLSVKDTSAALKKRFEIVDQARSTLAKLDNESKARHKVRVHSKKKKGKKHKKTALHRTRHRLRRLIRSVLESVTRLVTDMHHKLSSWLAANYSYVLLPSFQTADMVHRYFVEVDGDTALATAQDEESAKARKRKIKSPTARSMMCQAHYRFKELLKCKMTRAGGRVVVCGEEYTSKTCSACGAIKEDLGGNTIYRCAACGAVLDRDVNAAKNILHKNIEMLG